MIETEEQRRWWFATHPEYSSSRRGIRGDSERENDNKIDPEEVDRYVDEALKYETGAVADLLKSVKRNFGTEAELKDDLAKWKEAIEADKRGLEADPHTLLDILPYRRFITSPIQAFKNVIRRTAQDQVLSAIKKEGTLTPPRLPRRGTPEYNRIKAARDRGVRAKKKEELNEIRSGGKGSGVWSEEELEGIRKTGKFPEDAVFHHDPTVANRPDLAADPKVVHPIRGGSRAHLRDGHGGNYQDPREQMYKDD